MQPEPGPLPLPQKDGPANRGRYRQGRQVTKGRKGKGVTVISGLPVDDGELKPLATKHSSRNEEAAVR